MFKKILIATDFSKASKGALYAGLGLATKCLANVLSVHSVTPLELFASPQPMPFQGTEWQQQLETQFEDFFPKSLYPNSRKEIVMGRSPSEEIMKIARMEHCDLIVLGTHGYGFIGRTLLGSVTQQVTRESEIPVMVVRDVEHSEKKYQGYESVLVPTDFTDASLKALDFGVRFSNFLKADMHMMHVVDWPTITLFSSIYPGNPLVKLKDTQPDKSVLLKRLDELLARKELIGTSKTSTMTGDPVDEILLYAKKQNIDFIIMGTHGRKGLDRILLGSTTSGVIAKSEIPIITISLPF